MSVLRFLRDTAVDLCLGCRHDRLTRPFTIDQESYMVCLDCGRQLFYSVETMRLLSGRELRRMRTAARSGGVQVITAATERTTVAAARAAGADQATGLAA